MAKKVEVDIIINSEDSAKKLRELQRALKQVPVGTEDWKKIYGEIDDLKDKLDGAKKGTDDWVDTLENAGGPLGIVGAGINKVKVAFTSFNTALKASVIGLIVSAIGGLVAAFSQSEDAMKKLQPLFIGLQRILGGIFRAFEPVLDVFVEMVEYVLPPLTKGIGIFYSVLFGLFTLIKDVGVGVGKTLKGIFTFDWDSITEGVSQVANSIGNSVKAGEQAYARFQAGTKEQTKIEKEQAAERNKNAEEARKKREEAEKKAEEERKRREEEARKNREAANKVEEEAYLKLQSERDQALYKAGKDYNDQLTALEKAGITDRTLVQEAYRKTVQDINDKYDEEERKKLEEKNKKLFEDKQKQLELELKQSSGDLETQLSLIEQLQDNITNNTALNESERFELRKGYADQTTQLLDQTYQNQVQAINNTYGEFARFDKQYYADLKATQDQAQVDLQTAFDKGLITKEQFTKRDGELAKARKEINKQEVASAQEKTKLVGDALGQLSQIVGQDTVAGKAFAIAKATIDTYQSAVSAYKSLAGIPVIGPALGAIAAAAAVASGIATVKKIVSVQVPNAPSGGGSPLQSTPGGPAPGSAPSPVNVTAQKKAKGGLITRAEGGLVRGPGTETSDSISALLSDGEFVVNSRSTRLFQPLLSAINDFGLQPQFAAGGIVNGSKQNTGSSNTDQIAQVISDTFSAQPIRTYVTSADISNQQQFDRIIKSRSLI